MTMKEKIRVHIQIEEANHEHLEDWRCAMYWDSLSSAEVAAMIHEKDRAMEWDEQFGFLCDLLDRKLKEETK